MTAFTVVRGAPDEETLAVLTAVLLRRRRPATRPAPARDPVRSSPWRGAPYRAPGAWTSR